MSDPVEGTRGQTPDDVRGLPSAPRPEFASGETVPGLSSWVLERKLGGGGFGEVWLARHAWNKKEKPRAVKFCLDPIAKNRLVTHERNVVVRVMKYAGDHPNIVPLLDCNLDGDIPWLMYEFVEGGTLASLIQEWRELPLPKRLGKAVRALHAIASALATCHRLDPPLVHRDMKPQNVLMAGSVPRITDFGIGSVVMQLKDGDSTSALTAYAARLPSALHNAGTRLYAPAEQLFGSPPNPRDDVYALGIIAYQMVMGDLMTAPGPDANLELSHQRIPSELASLIVRSVAMNPDRRPKDAAEWESTLATIIEKVRKEAGSTGTSEIGSKPVLLSEPDLTKMPSARTVATEEAAVVPLPLPSKPQMAAELIFDEPPRANRESSRRFGSPARTVALVVVPSVLLLALGLGVAWVFLFPQEKQTEPSSPSKHDKRKAPEVVISAPKAGETCEIEIAPGMKMTFCWIPAGECQLGSPKDERDAVLKQISGAKEPDWLRLEAQELRGIFKTSGFWMGKYEVTQAEWEAVMGNNPSNFDGMKNNRTKGMDTNRFPVESVSWEMICKGGGFLEKANAQGGIRKTFGKPGKLVLPHEDQWEYACRGQQSNKQPFYFGDKLNGREANCNGSRPYGTTTKGLYLERTCEVDDTNSGEYAQHPWGLMHMHGNVWEWCMNEYTQSSRRVLRGGGWRSLARDCRAAYRLNEAPDFIFNDIGCRLCFRLDRLD